MRVPIIASSIDDDDRLYDINSVHAATKFLKIDAEKTPFFVGKLQIKVLPTVVFFKVSTHDYISICTCCCDIARIAHDAHEAHDGHYGHDGHMMGMHLALIIMIIIIGWYIG